MVREAEAGEEEEHSKSQSDYYSGRILELREELENIKSQTRFLQEQISANRKEELAQHRKIIDLKNAINTFKDFGLRLKLKNKQHKNSLGDGSAAKNLGNLLHGKSKRVEPIGALKPKSSLLDKQNDMILPVDLEQLKFEVQDLEARIQHK